MRARRGGRGSAQQIGLGHRPLLPCPLPAPAGRALPPAPAPAASPGGAAKPPAANRLPVALLVVLAGGVLLLAGCLLLAGGGLLGVPFATGGDFSRTPDVDGASGLTWRDVREGGRRFGPPLP